MEPIPTSPDKPGTEKQPETEREAAPPLPERTHKHEVESFRGGLLAVALLAGSMLFAQTTPPVPPAEPTTPTTKPGSTPQAPELPPVHSQPMPGQAPTPPTGTQQPIAPQAGKGWMPFDAVNGARLGLKGDQLQRLQEVDARYKDRYDGLGKNPWDQPNYAPLTEQRNRDIQGILTPEQYKEWMSMNGGSKVHTVPMDHGTEAPPRK